MNLLLNRLRQGAILLFLLASALSLEAQSTARINGRVVNSADGTPIENAKVSLDLVPTDGRPEREYLTDPFGFFELKDLAAGAYQFQAQHPHFVAHGERVVLAAGAYTNRVVRLDPIDGKVYFDIYFQVWCLSTHARLAGTTIKAEYWKPDGVVSGPPASVFNAVAGAAGDATLAGMEDGFYTFTVTRVGWEPLTYRPPANSGFITVGNKVRLIRYHYGSVFLRPVKQDLTVTVKGYDPVADKPAQALKAMTIKLTGIDLTDNTLEIVPVQTALSAVDGTYKFGNLAPIRWNVGVGRLGYVPQTVLVTPDATGALPDQTIQMNLEPTRVKVTVASPYQTVDAVKNAKIRLQGIRNSNTEGIDRELSATADPAGNTASALFSNLLPGRYWIRTEHEATISGLPSQSGPLRGPDTFQIYFFPKETFAEVTVGVTEEARMDLEPVPAKIRGRVYVTDELGNVETEVFDPEPNRVFHLKAQSGITFLEHKLIKLLEETNNSFTADSDAAGGYTVLVAPGIFGVRIPSMTDYTGHNVEYGDLTGGQPPQATPWPFADVWPYPFFEDRHHGAGLRFDSGHEYQVDLFLHAHYINLVGTVQAQGSPMGELILAMSPDGNRVVSYGYDHLWDTGAEIAATGTATITGRLRNRKGIQCYLLRGLKPGSYGLSVTHPNYTSTPANIAIAPWQPPGILPAVAPYSPTYFFPGTTHYDQRFNLVATWKTQGTISVQTYNWDPGNPPDDPPHYLDGAARPPEYFRMDGLPDRLFRFRSYGGGIPAPSYTVWLKHGDGWFSSGGSGTAMFQAYEGGPNDNTPPNQPPSGFTAYTLDLHAYSEADPKLEIPGVTVKFGPADSPRVAGGQVPHDGSPIPTGATHNQNQWFFVRGETELLNAATRLVRVTVFMRRAMVVSGKVGFDGGPVPGASVVLRNRYGNPVGSYGDPSGKTVTRDDGAFLFPSIAPQTVYLDVNRRGFQPQRHRYDPPSVSDPDIAADIHLLTVPAPTIDWITLNRFGLFLPGVVKSGDATGFNPENARETLTATWASYARGSNYQVSLEGYVQAGETQGPPEIVDVVDRVAEVWLVDRRAFTNAFVNELNQQNYQSVDPPSPLNYVSAQKWLETIYQSQKDGRRLHVVHQMARRGQTGPGNRFQGRLNLWELPSGAFRPRVVAITESGGVACKDYELPAGRQTLQGMNLPSWASGILEVIGYGANLGKFTDDIHAHYGEGYLKIGTISPVMEGRIGLDPSDAKPTEDTCLTYKYTLGLELPLGEGTSKTGPLNLGPEFLGFKAQGAKAEFEVKGKDMKAGLAINVSAVAPPAKVEERDSSYLPVVVKESKQVEVDAKLKYTVKAGITETLDADWLGNNLVSGFGFFLDGQGTVDVSVKANATPIVRFIPYAGPVLVTLDKSGMMTIKGVFETTLGTKLKVELNTRFPKYGTGGTTSLGDEPEHMNLLGGTELKKELKLILRLAAGLQISALRGSVEGTGLLQVGAPADTPSVEGVLFTVNPTTQGPLITKIEGAFSAVLRAGVNLWTVKYMKQWQWDIARFVVDRHSEPSFELVPMNITYSVINVSSSPQPQFIGKPDILIDRFYEAGSVKVTGSGRPLLVFTGTDPASGRMTILASHQTGGQWQTPIWLGAAAGVISVAAARDSAGEWLVVWSEVADGDVGNPYPSSTLKYRRSSPDGATWSAPAVLAASPEAMFDLKLAAAGNQIVLCYLSTPEGPVGQNQSLQSIVWDGNQWSAPVQRLAPQPIQSYSLTGNADTNVLAVVSTGPGDLVSLFWDGRHWTAGQKIAQGAGAAVSLTFPTAQTAGLAWENSSNALAFSTFDVPSRTWTHRGAPIPATIAGDCALLPLTVGGRTIYLVVWTEGGATTSIWSAFLDENGGALTDRLEVTLDSAGSFHGLQLRPLANGRASILARYSTPTNTTVREFSAGLPSGDDCDGDGVADSIAIALKIVPDCNLNGIPDACDIRNGTSLDRNHNGIPDECEAAPANDCNRNGISDAYELSLGIGDANGNGILDACEGGTQVKTVSLTTAIRTRFYRASKISVRSVGPQALELQYEGVLEQAGQVTGPWSVVP